MKAFMIRSRSLASVAGIAAMAAVLLLVAGTSDAARGARVGGGARAGGYAYRGGAVRGGAPMASRAGGYAYRGGVTSRPYGQSPTYRSWSSGHYAGGGGYYGGGYYRHGGWHGAGYPYYPPYGYYAPHAYISFGFGVPYYAPVYGYPVYYPAPDVTTTDATGPPADAQAPDSQTPAPSVETPALVDSTTSFDVTNDPPPGCYYYDRFCKRRFANLDDYTDHLQGQSHPATIEIMEKDGTGMLELEFVGGVWRVRH